jgi:nucleotide-binding universal stress UspA family protein
MYKHILVAMDGSPHAEKALQHALQLARETSAELRILHVVDMTWMLVGSEFAIDTTQVDAVRQEVGERILAKARETARVTGVDAQVRLVKTDTPAQHIADTIATEAADWPADLVVVGTHGYRGFRHLLLGSVAEGVARICTTPVLFIR